MNVHIRARKYGSVEIKYEKMKVSTKDNSSIMKLTSEEYEKWSDGKSMTENIWLTKFNLLN